MEAAYWIRGFETTKLVACVVQILVHFHVNNLLPTTQFGFRKGSFGETALLGATDDILRAIDNGLLTILVLLDFSNDLDAVSYKSLISIIQSCGFSTQLIKLMESLLDSRM